MQPREHFIRLRLQRVPGEDGDGFAIDDMARGLAAAQIIIVERGQIVVDKRIGVKHLNGGAEVCNSGWQSAGAEHHAGRFHAQNGAQPLAPGEDAVAHGAMDGVRQNFSCGKQAVERGIRQVHARLEYVVHSGLHHLR